jgi:outer membrane protein OmpA-like peptidoglycan-associated protein
MVLQTILTPKTKTTHNDEHWIPLSDLMTGLMMIFMLIAILFMLKIEDEKKEVETLRAHAENQANKIKSVAILYDELREQLYNDLKAEFQGDLSRWKAKLDRDLAIRFEEPEVLFYPVKAALKPQFARILDDFFPRYARILASQKYRESIEEIRVEGHTSTIWAAISSADVAYFRNMELSQGRTRSVLEYVLQLPSLSAYKSWLVSRVTANGLSSSRLRLTKEGREDREASQRVEFRVRTNAEARIGDILREAQK